MHGASHEVLGRLAVGGMAELYLARTTHDDGRREIVVLKRILPHLAEDPEFVRMFRDEAYLAATLDHPNIVHVHDIGQDGEDYFFTMEYVHGENIRTLIKAAQKQETTLPVEHVVNIAKGVCDGLHYAHEQKDENGEHLRIVHRDVSPTNILVSSDGEVKIVDFGIAKAAAATHVTQAGMLKGKASYMSPEQCRAEPVDRRSDVFAIGILIYEMTTLTRLFRGDNELAVLHQILTGTVEAPSTRVDHYDPELERVVMRALAQKPDDRYPTAQALREDLERYEALRGLSSSSESVGVYIRDLCGDKPFPWDEEDEEDQPLAAVDQSATGTGMPTSMGNFEDEEDTQVNRKAPDLRTMVPGAPSEWTNKPPPRPNAPGMPGRPGVHQSPRPGAPPPGNRPRPTPGDIRRRSQSAARGLNPNRPRLSGAARGAGIPLSDDPAAPELGQLGELGDPLAESTAPMSKPGVARTPTPRPGRRMPAPTGGPPQVTATPPGQSGPPRSGRTLTGEGAGPLPPRSGRTIPGGQQAKGAGQPRPGGRPSRPGPPRPGNKPAGPPRSPQPRRQTSPTAGRPSPPPGSPRRPAPRPPAAAARTPAPASRPVAPSSAAPPSETDRTQALSPEQAREMARLGAAASPPSRPAPPPGPTAPTPNRPAPPSGPAASPPNRPHHPQGAAAWSGTGVDHTEIAPSGTDIDEGARTLALPRYDRTMLAAPGQDFPKGPTGWGDSDPLTQTQKSTAQAAPDPLTSTQKSSPSPAAIAALTATQKTPGSALTSTQRAPSAAYPEVGAAAVPAEIRRPEMRSPSPRPPKTPRSLWVPVLIIVIVGLAGTAVWLLLSSANATVPKNRAPSPTATEPAVTPSAPSEAATPTPENTTPRPAPIDQPVAPEGGDAENDDAASPEPFGDADPVPAPEDDTEPAGDEPAAEPTAEPTSADARPQRPRRPRRPKDPTSAPGGDLPEIKPGRPVPP